MLYFEEFFQNRNINQVLGLIRALSGARFKPRITKKKEFPKKFIVSFGYTGWSAGQLEKEIQQGSWLIIPANEQIIFSTKSSKKIEEASKIAGFNINLVSNNYGKA